MNHPHQDPTCVYWSDGDPDVPAFQRPTEFTALLQLHAERRPRRVLEIGTYYGGTLKQWLRRARPGDLVVSVDRYDIPRADNRARYSSWTPAGVRLEVIAGDSAAPATAAAARALGPFDWVFVDADHTLAACTRDWEVYGAMCAPGGVVILHDIVSDPARHPEIEVATLWAQIRASGAQTIEYVEDYGEAWGGLGVVLR